MNILEMYLQICLQHKIRCWFAFCELTSWTLILKNLSELKNMNSPIF